MRLYVENIDTKQKIYLSKVAPTRNELAILIGSTWFLLNGDTYHVNEVVAESNSNNVISGALVGGVIGLLGGGVGALLGSILGGAYGNETDKTEFYNVDKFNASRI